MRDHLDLLLDKSWQFQVVITGFFPPHLGVQFLPGEDRRGLSGRYLFNYNLIRQKVQNRHFILLAAGQVQEELLSRSRDFARRSSFFTLRKYSTARRSNSCG